MAPCMKRRIRVEGRLGPELEAGRPFADVEAQAQHEPWKVSTHKSSLTQPKAGSPILSMASDIRRTKPQKTLVV